MSGAEKHELPLVKTVNVKRLLLYDPEFTNNFELSLRSAWLNDDLVVYANVFFLDWKDMQVSVEGDTGGRFDYYTVNDGSAEVKGFEVESFYTMSENFKLNAGVGFSKTEFTDFVDDEDVYTGGSFARAPEWTANLGATYTSDSGIFVNVNANYQDSSADKLVALSDPEQATRSATRTIVNTRVGYNWDNFGLFLTAKNLLGNDYYAFRTTGGSRTQQSVKLGAERQVSLSFEVKF
ncbi:TonB-dependent receptor [Shewanella sp. 202IG2-18]|uniref:TonB-dependent receptor domain-containing protein n=1 Tax=Parashewanella hymeniacidonis TaxID=2807618 RepID=UPI0019600546|nr:TonB-dependent receptor [Parashewanella hymeniacidonis]MBM7072608.1 TonB-dependent receptor [Parashewanella hymeniacidonis]